MTSSATRWPGTRSWTQSAPEMLGDHRGCSRTGTANLGPPKRPRRRPRGSARHDRRTRVLRRTCPAREQPGCRCRARTPTTRARTYPRRPGSSRPPRGAPCPSPARSLPVARRPRQLGRPRPGRSSAGWAGRRGRGEAARGAAGVVVPPRPGARDSAPVRGVPRRAHPGAPPGRASRCWLDGAAELLCALHREPGLLLALARSPLFPPESFRLVRTKQTRLSQARGRMEARVSG